MANSANDWKVNNASIKHTFRDRGSVESHSPRYAASWIDGVSNPDYTYRYAAGASSRILDENHVGYHRFMRQRAANVRLRTIDMGAPLVIERVSVTDPGGVKGDVLWGPGQYRHYDGVYAPSSAYLSKLQSLKLGIYPTIPTDVGMAEHDLQALGSTAIAKSLPNVPAFRLARFIGELREGLPKVPLKELAKSQRKVSSLGSEYLNVQFGLLPTVSDVSKLIQLVGHPELRARVEHALNQEFRVRKVVRKDESTSTRALLTNEMNTLPAAFVQSVSGYETTSYTSRTWSSVSFMYFHSNRLLDLLDGMDEQLGNFGSIPNMIDAWNLTAWSWFIDWFTNFNHVLTNLSYLGRDGLMIQHGYIMSHHRRRVTTVQNCRFAGRPVQSVGVIDYERKYRVRASPFGFGLTWREFSPFQTSILAALGVNRLRF